MQKHHWLIIVTTERFGQIKQHHFATSNFGGLTIKEAVASVFPLVEVAKEEVGPIDHIKGVSILLDMGKVRRELLAQGDRTPIIQPS
jgi:hypothetical protein